MILIIVIIIAFNSVQAEERNSYGLNVGYGLNLHNGQFSGLPGIPSCCPEFVSGWGSGFDLNIDYNYVLSNLSTLKARLGINRLDGNFLSKENVRVLDVNLFDNGYFNHELNSQIQNTYLGILYGYNINNLIQVNVGVALNFIGNTTFNQREVLVEPSNRGTFLNEDGTDSGKRTRNENNGNIPLIVSVLPSINFAASKDFRLDIDETLFLTTEINYAYFIGNVVENLDWNMMRMGFGLGIKYSPIIFEEKFEYQQKIDTFRVIVTQQNKSGIVSGQTTINYDTITVGTTRNIIEHLKRTDTLFAYVAPEPIKPNFNLNLQIRSTNELGDESGEIVFKVEEFLTTLMTPILNYIFFEENESELPNKYSRLSTDQIPFFNEARENSIEKLSTYYHVLNIIGSRFKKYPDTQFTLIGCNSDQGVEKGNLELSKNRAISVKNYLTSVWGVPEKQIKIINRNLPDKYTRTNNELGYQENRRVEILANRKEIFAPVISQDTVRIANPPTLKLFPKTDLKNLDSWQISITQIGQTLHAFAGKGVTPDSLVWEANSNSGTQVAKTEPIEIRYTASKNNFEDEVKEALPVKQLTLREKVIQKVNDRIIEKYSLILFEVGTSTLSNANNEILNFIKSHIDNSSKVDIVGYTDVLVGNQTDNEKLAKSRGISAAKMLNLDENSVKGISTKDLYNNLLPEGRFYNRTVDITLETDLKRE